MNYSNHPVTKDFRRFLRKNETISIVLSYDYVLKSMARFMTQKKPKKRMLIEPYF